MPFLNIKDGNKPNDECRVCAFATISDSENYCNCEHANRANNWKQTRYGVVIDSGQEKCGSYVKGHPRFL